MGETLQYPTALLAAQAAEKRGDHDIAFDLYTRAMNFLLFRMMFDYANEQVKSLQEARFRCLRARRSSPEGEANG
jgi:hypothetical protein